MRGRSLMVRASVMVRKRKEGWARTKGHLFLLSHIVGLGSRTVRDSHANLAFLVAKKVCFPR